jgi:hypothetical protein
MASGEQKPPPVSERAEDELRRRLSDLTGDLQESENEVHLLRLGQDKLKRDLRRAETKLDRKRDKIGEFKNSDEEKTSVIADLEAHIEELAERERQREPTYKRGKLLREMCDPPHATGLVGYTEHYVPEVGTSFVIELTNDCARPRSSMSGRFRGPIEVLAAKLVSNLQPNIMLQHRLGQTAWHDCCLIGPAATNGSKVAIKHLGWIGDNGPAIQVPQEVSVDRLRFADPQDEEEFFATIE